MRTLRAQHVSTSAEVSAPRYSPLMRQGRWARAPRQLLFFGLCLAAIGFLSMPSRDESGIPGFLLGLLGLCVAAVGCLIWLIRMGQRQVREGQRDDDVPESPDR